MTRKHTAAAVAIAALISAPAFAAEVAETEEPKTAQVETSAEEDSGEFDQSKVAEAKGNIVIEAPWAVSMKDDELIVFMDIHNGAETDTISAVSADIAKNAVMAKFKSTLRDSKELETLDAKGGEVTHLDQDGYHLLLTGLTDEIENGDTVKLTLSFEETGDLEIEVSVSVIE